MQRIITEKQSNQIITLCIVSIFDHLPTRNCRETTSFE